MVRISGNGFWAAKGFNDNSAAVESFGEEAKMVYDQRSKNYWTTLMFYM
jgi:hypothetical protein